MFDGAAVIGRIPDMRVPDWTFLRNVMQNTAEHYMCAETLHGKTPPECTVTSGFAVAGRIAEITAEFELKTEPSGIARLEMKNPELIERKAKHLNAILN